MGLVGKLIHEATSSLKEGEPSSSSKTIKLLISKHWIVTVQPLLR